jgi:hypothetical protein
MDREFNIYKQLGVTQREMCILTSSGYFNNMFPVYVVGRNFGITADPEDITAQGGTYTYATGPETWYLSSSDDTDAEQFTIQGLTDQFVPFIETVTLSGFTGVQIRTDCYRFHVMRNSNGTPSAGDVYVSTEATPVDGVPALVNTRAKAPVVCQRSWHGAYTIPDGWTGFVASMSTMLRGKTAAGVDIEFRVRPENKIMMCEYVLPVGENKFASIDLEVPYPLVARTDVAMRGVEPSATNKDVVPLAAATILLVKNTTFK